MGPGESQLGKISVGATKILFLGVLEHHAMPFNELKIPKIKAAK